jgi:hypothetical protein
LNLDLTSFQKINEQLKLGPKFFWVSRTLFLKISF